MKEIYSTYTAAEKRIGALRKLHGWLGGISAAAGVVLLDVGANADIPVLVTAGLGFLCEAASSFILYDRLVGQSDEFHPFAELEQQHGFVMPQEGLAEPQSSVKIES